MGLSKATPLRASSERSGVGAGKILVKAGYRTGGLPKSFSFLLRSSFFALALAGST